ncbi:hypothetical protein KLP28_12400 [Nocardioidaceae bacterium]|nr:hypothetical protein KLP28_12400 [Nocardioidaceae bacterium]
MTARAIFGEEDDALAVARRLRADGFEATAAREPFAGEDDDEDHAWAVRTDAPEAALDLLCEEYDGWLDAEPPPHSRPPLDLPAAPRRHHRPPRE